MRLIILSIVCTTFLYLTSCSEDSAVNNNPVVKVEIKTQPIDATVYDGQIASFSVFAKGTNNSYKWYKDEVFYDSSAQITIVATDANNGAEFYCEVSNSAGNVLSDTVMLEVVDSPDPEYRDGMCKIPAQNNSFVMGSVSSKALGNEAPTHTVAFTNSFWIGAVPVSRYSYETVMKNAYPITHIKMPWNNSSESLPADSISWNDAILYCNALSKENGIDSAYNYEALIIVEDSDTNKTELRLRDSLLIRKIGEMNPDSIFVKVEDSIAIIPADTIKKTSAFIKEVIDTISLNPPLFDTTRFNEWGWDVIPAETVTVVPYESYQLSEFSIREFEDYTVVEGEKIEEIDTVVKTVSETVYVRITSNGIEDTVYHDTLIIKDGAIFDMNQVFVEWLYDTNQVLVEGQYDIIEGVNPIEFPTGYRLPTEAEWEFAARGGSGSDYFWGSETEIDTYAWSSSNSESLKSSGSLKKSNLYGVHDMSGNVWEWCYDYYSLYSSEPQDKPLDDPSGPNVGERRVMRGGSWKDLPIYLRSSQRGRGLPGRASAGVGFRTVKTELAE